ncbi:hypothetical protein LTR56_007597 [Elasticomyces elasticus]|nr:hypothetical protein LTR56_007597 [Elasticomyces elasticus]KAK3665298.1 hypothetical protein LTR22_003820 [Elasticomyces elasticus]KAK4929729.1 hypothetical protein LTR49_003687 [Elasticomyces elasticus]KAK5761051.1 hypothetical protein LTS12_008728 [Elasticomyces elasticus]
MAPLIAILLAAAYGVDKMNTAPRQVKKKKKKNVAFEAPTTTRQIAIPPPPPPPGVIHPIFRQISPGQGGRLFLPALELASRFLTAKCFLGFWYTVFYSPVEQLRLPLEGFPTTPGTKHYGFTTPMPSHLSRSQIAITDIALTDLASCVTFDLYSASPERAGARCKHLRGLSTPPPFHGHRSCIQVSEYFYDMLSDPGVSSADKTWLQFELAKTLLHELAHAALNAARDKGSKTHYFFSGCNIAEDGFQLEACLFGGKTDLRRSEFHDQVARQRLKIGKSAEPLIRAYLTPWPSWEAVEEYRVRGSLIGIRGRVPSYPHGREVRFERVRRLFTEEPWEEDVKRYGSLRLC